MRTTRSYKLNDTLSAMSGSQWSLIVAQDGSASCHNALQINGKFAVADVHECSRSRMIRQMCRL
jgi:hypothetical protein